MTAAPQQRRITAVEYGCPSNPRSYDMNDAEQAIKSILEHEPRGPGDTWFYQVEFLDGTAVRVFNHLRVFFGKPESIVPVKPTLIV